MKILIVGFGKMGNSHFNSFLKSKKKYTIFLVDKKFKKNYKKDYKNKKILFFQRIPKNETFNLAIVATSSNERYKIIKKILDNNKLKYLLLEKFLFNKINEYKKLKEMIKRKKVNVMVNVWGRLILMPIINKLNKTKITKVELICKSGELITNLIHFYDFLYFLIRKKFHLKIKNVSKILKSRKKGYDEINAEIFSEKKPLISIKTKKNINYHLFKISYINNEYVIKINYNGKCQYYFNNKNILNSKFPFSYLVTEKFFSLDFKNSKKKYFNNLEGISRLSLDIIKLININRKKKLCIT